MWSVVQMAALLCACVLIDTFVVRMVVVPSIMVLLGEANWYWPSFAQCSRKNMIDDTSFHQM
jgi:uncharacterized membrane protein YdfJ with MMPL/SSD domain